MTDLALIRLQDQAVVRVFPAGMARLDLPDGAVVMPPVAGWRGGGEVSYVKAGAREIAMEGAPRYAIVKVESAVVPDGFRRAGPTSYAFDAARGIAREIVTVEEIPPAPEPERDPLDDIRARLDAIEAEVAKLKGSR